MSTASKRTVKKGKDEKEVAREKTMPQGHKRLRVSFFGKFRWPRVFKFARYEMQTDGVTTVLRIFELSTNREFTFPFTTVKEIRG